MITKVNSHEVCPTIISEKYESDVYTIEIVIMDNKIDTITIYSRKYLYPGIFVDHREFAKNKDAISLDFDNIVFVTLAEITKLQDNINYAKDFIDKELKPFLESKLS
jgi:hypothetical protein